MALDGMRRQGLLRLANGGFSPCAAQLATGQIVKKTR